MALSPFTKAAALTAIVAIAAAILLPNWLGFYYLQVANLTLVSALLTLGLNFILGYAGQMSLAQAAFFGIGAYGFAILQGYGVPSPIAALLAVAITAAVGLLLGGPTLRLKGHYLALATLSFAVIMEKIFVNLDWLTGGADGLSNIAGIGLAGNNVAMCRVLIALTSLAFLGSVAFAMSPIGLRSRAFRDDAVAAEAVGVNINRMKLMLFVISSAYAGLAGVAYVCLRGYISPDVFAWQTTFSYLAMVVVGGLGSSVGAILGAILYTLVPEWLRFLQEAYFVIFGLVVVLVITFFPAGLAGILAKFADRIRLSSLVRHRVKDPAASAASKMEGQVP